MNVAAFPFDTQNCTWPEASMKYFSHEIHLSGVAFSPGGFDKHPGEQTKFYP
jgi:hypothetical protein